VSQENVEIVRALLEGFAARDHARAFDLYDANIEWDASAGEELNADLAGIYHGHAGVRTYWRNWLSAWRDIEFEVEEVLDAGDEVVALIGNQRQWGRHSGIQTEMPPYALVFTIRNGKVVRWRSFSDRQAALKAVGLEE
jgi:ketosteroid isomerase-like protein